MTEKQLGTHSKNKRVGRRYSPKQRRNFLKSFHRSGLSVHAFCLNIDLCHTTLRKWLRKEDCSKDSPAEQPRLMELKLDGDGDLFASPMEVTLPDGMTIRVHSKSQVAWAEQLVAFCKDHSC
jgi:transposase-like protein